MIDFGILLKTITPTWAGIRDVFLGILGIIAISAVMFIVSFIISKIVIFLFIHILYPIFGDWLLLLFPITFIGIIGNLIIWQPLHFRYLKLKRAKEREAGEPL
jgi:hypothetical protein